VGLSTPSDPVHPPEASLGWPKASSIVLACSSMGDPSEDRRFQAISASFVRDTCSAHINRKE
jgi:hypothetical protein